MDNIKKLYIKIFSSILYPIIGFISDISIYYAVGFLGLLTFVFALFGKVDENYL